MMARSALTLVGLAVLVAGWLYACTGPRPVVVSSRVVSPTQPGGPVGVEAVLRNGGPGTGEVAVTIRLRPARADGPGGATMQVHRAVELERDETTRLFVEFAAPPGEYTAEVEAVYPPR